MAYSQRRIDHALRVMSLVDEMRLGDFICDFKIKVGSKIFHVHRLILAANSGYFKSLFSSNMKEMQESYVVLTSVIAPSVMQQCIDYMYTSISDLQPDTVSEVLHAANFLQIVGLESECVEFLKDKLTPENSLTILTLARTFNNRGMEKAAEEVIRNNLEMVIRSELFYEIAEQDLLQFFSDTSYGMLWDAITAKSRRTKKEYLSLVKTLGIWQYPFWFLLTALLEDPLVSESCDVKSHFITGLFSDSARLEENLGIKNCLQLKKMATDEYSKLLIDSFIKENFPFIIFEPAFCSLSLNVILDLLRSPSLGVYNEQFKWEAIRTWVKSDVIKRDKQFIHLFCCLNLEKFTVEFLENTICQEKLVQEDLVCREMLLGELSNRRQPTVAMASLSNSPIQVLVKTPHRKTITLKVRPLDTIASIKKIIHKRERIPTHRQFLMNGCRLLNDNDTLKEYHKDSYVQLDLRVRLDRQTRGVL